MRARRLGSPVCIGGVSSQTMVPFFSGFAEVYDFYHFYRGRVLGVFVSECRGLLIGTIIARVGLMLAFYSLRSFKSAFISIEE